jgi:hypothetical protein
MLFSKGSLVVGSVASTNPMETGISCVHLNPDGSTVATNGKVIMAVGPVDESKVHFPDVGVQVAPAQPNGVSVPLDLLEKVLKNMPRDKRVSLQHAALTQGTDPAKVELTVTDQRHTQRIEGFPLREPFPNWRGILQKVRGATTTRICLNRKDLIDLLKAQEEACPDRGNENLIFIEVETGGRGMTLRSVNRETGQRAIGGINGYNVGQNWLPLDSWERDVLAVQPMRRIITK